MADSGTSLLEQVDSSQAQHEITVNALVAALSIAGAYGRHAEECAGLTWGYYGVRFGGAPIANGTHACDDEDTTYMVVDLATGDVSFSTSITNWNDDATYGRCYLIVAAAGVLTWEDHRFGPGGVIGPGIAGSGGGGGSRTPAIQAVTSSSTVTPTFSDDIVTVTAQAAALILANPTGTPIASLGMVIRIKDNGTARAISYGTQYRALGVTLPTTTVVGKTLYLAMIYNANDTKWDVLAVGQEA